MSTPTNPANSTNSSLVISYLNIRRIIGLLGIALPIVLLLGSIMVGDCEEIQSSISGYYHTNMRDVMVGILCAVSMFLFSYRGYDMKDLVAGKLGSMFALGIALFPTPIEDPLPACNIFIEENAAIIGNIHFLSATLFFGVLIYFSLFLFPLSSKAKSDFSQKKKNRNKVFLTCGWVMVACIVSIFIYMVFLQSRYESLASYDLVFWFESIALWAFGISWLTKGQLIFEDNNK